MLIPTAGLIGGQGYMIENSVMFDEVSNTVMYRVWTGAGSADTSIYIKTYSWWIKRTGGLGQRMIMNDYYNANNNYYIQFLSDNTIQIYAISGGVQRCLMETTRAFNDTSEWYHIVLAIDTTQATATNRLSLYINGEEITDWDTATYPTQNQLSLSFINPVSGAYYHYHGIYYNSTLDFVGLFAEHHTIDGQKLGPDSFGKTDPGTGQWVPIEYAGTYGTNGFAFDYANSAALGTDVSGNGWDMTVTNMGTDHQYQDTPTNNHCTMNPYDETGLNILEGGLYLNRSGGTGNYSIRGNIGLPRSGKWYFEHKIKLIGGSIAQAGAAGICSVDEAMVAAMFNAATANGFLFASGTWYKTTDGTTGAVATGTSGMALNDVMQIAIDLDAGKMWVGKNGTWNNSGDPAAGTGADITGMDTDRDYIPFVTPYNSVGTTYILPIMDFGQRGFDHTPPSGFKAITSNNLPKPDIKKPKLYFEPIIYTGTGAEHAITALDFSPDIVWIKNRPGTNWHRLFDSSRGATKEIYPNETDVEGTDAQGLKSFDSNGFTLGTNVAVNDNGDSHVAWCWKEGATPGVDVIAYTGTGVARTIAHNLGVKPQLMITKRLTSFAGSFITYWEYDGATKYHLLDTSANVATLSSAWNDTEPTSSVFSLGTAANNQDGAENIAYLFASVPGFSKIGTYVGNNSADGPFVYCGFKPAFLMIKSGAYGWFMNDIAREPINPIGDYVRADVGNAELTFTGVDFHSNGFKLIVGNAAYNPNAIVVRYIAFAESPFKYSRAK